MCFHGSWTRSDQVVFSEERNGERAGYSRCVRRVCHWWVSIHSEWLVKKEVMTGCSYVVFEMVANPHKSWNFGEKAYNSWLKVPWSTSISKWVVEPDKRWAILLRICKRQIRKRKVVLRPFWRSCLLKLNCQLSDCNILNMTTLGLWLPC